MHYKIAQLILTPGSKASTTSEIFVAQPDSNKENLVGKLFAVIEIESKKVNDLKIINFLVENLNTNYYQSEKMILRERVKTVKIEHIFESALAKTNKNLAEFLRTEKIKLNPKLINATLGVIYENNLHFANIGKNKAFLIYKSKNNTDKYMISDIAKNAEADEKNPQINMAKLFSSVISGVIPKNGYFVFTNEALPEYVSNKKLIEIITTLPPSSAAEQIKNDLSKINHYVSFLELIIKNTTGHEKKGFEGPIVEPTIEESVSGLNKMEDRTEKLLTPGGIINAKKWLNILSIINPKKLISKKTKKAIGAETLRDKIFFKRKTNLLFFKKAWVIIKNILVYLVNILVYSAKTITNKEKMLELVEKIKGIPGALKEKIKKFSKWFKGLSAKNKVLLVVAVGALFLLAQNLLVLSIKNNQIEEEKAFTNLVKPIEQKQNQVEASLLYGNEDGARALLSEIKDLMAALPRDTEEQIQQYKTFEEKLNEQLEKIRHVVKIENPKEIANFSNLNPEAKPKNLIISPNKKIYAGDASQETIYSLDTSDNLITAITGVSAGMKNIKYPLLSKNEQIYYLNNTNVIELNSETEEINSLTIDLSGNPLNVVAAAGYNNRLYLLDKKENKIYRYNKRPAGFTEEISWLKEKADFSNAVSLSIDGRIYVLKADGTLLKYLKGVSEDFELDIAEPAIEEATKVTVSPELKFIYILEPSKQRLLIFDKTGDFLMQYKVEQFTDLKDFIVNETTKKIYFLNGSSVYEVDGVHFEE